jgi:hypothetical protein
MHTGLNPDKQMKLSILLKKLFKTKSKLYFYTRQRQKNRKQEFEIALQANSRRAFFFDE